MQIISSFVTTASKTTIKLNSEHECRPTGLRATLFLSQLRDKLSQTVFPQTWLWEVYPPSPHIVQNSRELSVKGASAPPFIGGLPLTGGPGCSIARRRDGGISSRAAPFPMIGKGRGDWVEHERRFTYELYEQSL